MIPIVRLLEGARSAISGSIIRESDSEGEDKVNKPTEALPVRATRKRRAIATRAEKKARVIAYVEAVTKLEKKVFNAWFRAFKDSKGTTVWFALDNKTTDDLKIWYNNINYKIKIYDFDPDRGSLYETNTVKDPVLIKLFEEREFELEKLLPISTSKTTTSTTSKRQTTTRSITSTSTSKTDDGTQTFEWVGPDDEVTTALKSVRSDSTTVLTLTEGTKSGLDLTIISPTATENVFTTSSSRGSDPKHDSRNVGEQGGGQDRRGYARDYSSGDETNNSERNTEPPAAESDDTVGRTDKPGVGGSDTEPDNGETDVEFSGDPKKYIHYARPQPAESGLAKSHPVASAVTDGSAVSPQAAGSACTNFFTGGHLYSRYQPRSNTTSRQRVYYTTTWGRANTTTNNVHAADPTQPIPDDQDIAG